MADTAQPSAAGAAATTMDDPFVSTPPHAHPPPPLRHAAFDPEAFSLQSNGSPRQARLALEAHMKETDRRIQEASKLGTSLVQQRKELQARLKDLSEHKDNDEIGSDLRKKLADLEREYTDVGRETARAVLPKSRLASGQFPDPSQSPAVFAGVSGASPSKVAVPSRKQRNQPSNRVHDIEFATEISTSLLAQVRSLQAALVEKDDALKLETSDKAQLESEYATLRSRLRHLDENEQKYKDENWNLETQMQDMTAAMKLASEKEQRANQSLKSAQAEKETTLRELEDLKQTHGKLNDDVAASKRSQESELHLLRRDIADHESERDQLQRKIDELTSQNTELARAISYRMNGDGNGLDNQFGSGDDELTTDREFSEASPPPSPTKRAPGQGVLETETLRSSIQHAHRMIQTLKNNIHREKTEKLELKRMLQDARDELESRRGDNKANNLKNRRSMQDTAKTRRARADQLGANRVSREEVINDPDWEDHEGDTSMRTSTTLRQRKLSMPGAFTPSEESTDAFETANEKDTSTETEAFQTSNEAAEGESSGEATETEAGPKRGETTKNRFSSLPSSMSAKRASFMSTASTSADEEDDDIRTPVMAQPRYKIKNVKTRGSLRDGTSNNNSPAFSGTFRDSPAYSHLSSNRSTPIAGGQTLGDELDGLSDEESVEGTPSRKVSTVSATATPEAIRQQEHATPAVPVPEKPISSMVDSGMMTEPWEPVPAPASVPAEATSDTEGEGKASKGVLAATAGALGGLVTGSMLSRRSEEPEAAQQEKSAPSTPKTKSFAHNFSNIFSSHTEPVKADSPKPAPLTHEYAVIRSQHTEPEAVPEPEVVDEPFDFAFSPIKSQQFEPWSPSENGTVFPPRRSSKRPDTVIHTGAGEVLRPTEKSFDEEAAREPAQENRGRAPFAEIANNAAGAHRPGSGASVKSIKPRLAMSDEGTQTMVSADEIDRMMRNKNASTNGVAAGFVTPGSPTMQTSPRRSSEPGLRPETAVVRRPGSSGNMRKSHTPPPPLPTDLYEKISQAGGKPIQPTTGSMGPPLMPASAYRTNQRDPSVRSRTSTINTAQKAPSMRGPVSGSMRSPISRRSSVSSFASEVDQRLNPNGPFAYPADIPPATDPRMITAITQTMIGEYLWKYTRSPLSSSSISSNRHRRFFWVHPYTRTLYWSEHDPSTAGKSQLKAKSVAIEAVRVISDDNAYPPGLYSKSLVVVTPAREIVFTAPTAQRHETWFNALSYLLLRTAPTSDANTAAALGGAVAGGAPAGQDGEINDEDVAEFNPAYGAAAGSRSTTRQTGRSSHVSVNSYGSAATGRSAASQRPHYMDVPTLTPNTATATRRDLVSPEPTTPLRSPRSPSVGGRISSMFTGRGRESFSSRRSRTSTGGSRAVNGAGEGVRSESAEDLRRRIEEEERRERLENVRACCDGKHDVGSLSRRTTSFRGRGDHAGGHSHSHGSVNGAPGQSVASRV